ncbi:Zn-ribbon domain-containing OB-fold protein [Aeromicrobium duanguangcaii]|uniref:OB-fold domain-containing protein n=1 Tax=Aeromicrobium duanguangcaii TaxID=2968086 RepID=A0ABY5KJA4_9ACTN|nr:OB-fold domain-containing protein [Aeromicrobium duanguangcaii]MCD9154506.1 OB-fold domain-containing protein [Aeromicrobium duanguangcaii]MCL3838254.1 OB-fold domain-containing protein [Aeromicrobium duanguangcaii]UUI68438.1 OB-fold domain-containing protein [Aeromicrobium duanguangcaii]
MSITDTKPRADVAERFVPRPTPETQPFWDGTAAGELRIQSCLSCTEPFFYPRTSCPTCGSQDLEWIRCSGRGTLYSYVISARPAPGFDGPTVIAVVELEEGPRMMTNIVGVVPDPANLPLDLPVRVAFEDRGRLQIPVFEPDEEATR